MESSSTRRQVLAATGAVATAGLAGCTGLLGSGAGSNVPSAKGEVRAESLPTPVRGNPDADVTVMAFEDYSCGHCQTYVLDVVPDLAENYIDPGTIRYEHHDFPIPVAQYAWPAANAARAVQDTVGVDAFYDYNRLLYENRTSLSPSTYATLAEQVGADPDTVRSAAEQLAYQPVIKADRQKGINLGVEGTPTIFVNGEKLPDYAFSTIVSAIENERQRQG